MLRGGNEQRGNEVERCVGWGEGRELAFKFLAFYRDLEYGELMIFSLF